MFETVVTYAIAVAIIAALAFVASLLLTLAVWLYKERHVNHSLISIIGLIMTPPLVVIVEAASMLIGMAEGGPLMIAFSLAVWIYSTCELNLYPAIRPTPRKHGIRAAG